MIAIDINNQVKYHYESMITLIITMIMIITVVWLLN